VAAAAVAVACRAAPEAPAPATIDLLSRFADVDCRSDTLDLPFLLSRSLLKHRGFEQARDPATKTTWLWLAGTEGTLELPFATVGPKTLRLTARCKVSQRPQLPVTVSLNGHVVASLALTPDGAEHRVDLPSAVQVAGRNELVLEARPRAGRPPRPMMLTRLDLVPAGGATGAPPLRAGDGLRLPSGATVSYPLHVAESGEELEVTLRGGPVAPSRLRVTLEGDGGQREIVVLTAGAGAARHERVPLPPRPLARLTLSSVGATWLSTLRLRTPSPPAGGRASASADHVPPRPNLVLFVADAVRADLLSAYGYPRPTSPRFDAFARGGWLFEDATAQSASTRPSVASLLTGLGVDGHGVVGLGSTIVAALTTLPEALHGAGYATAAFVANDVLSPTLGYAQGFDVWSPFPRRPSAEVVRAALAWTREHRGPFFVYIHTMGAHRPYEPAQEHWRPFLPASLPRVRDVNALVQKPRLAPDEMAFVRSAYEGEIHEGDAAFGALLDGLEAQGVGGKTVIVFTADHGEGFEEHGHRGHGVRLYQETAHVPLALRVPGTAGGVRVASPVQHIDLAPTFLARAGVPKPPDLLGWDLASVVRGRPSTIDPARVLVSRLTYAGADKVAVRWGTLKLIANEEPDVPSTARFELYDLARDPGETRNVASEMPEAVEYLWMESRALRSGEEEMRARAGAGRKVELSPEDKEALRALGYVE
jgi:arylsulfatase A-like enzyme